MDEPSSHSLNDPRPPIANRELRELAHGLLPDVLTPGGLSAGVESIVLGFHVPVELPVSEDAFSPTCWEATAELDSPPGAGTRIAVTLPLRR